MTMRIVPFFLKGLGMLSTRWRPQPTAGSDDAAPRWRIPDPEWDVLRIGRAHVLLEGEKSRVREIIFYLTPQLPHTATWWQPGAPWPTAQHTVIIENVDALSMTDQCDLFDHLAHGQPGVQVISTCSTSLYAAVQRGDFLPHLYYRLNMLRIDIP
jgi:hypothetical protein